MTNAARCTRSPCRRGQGTGLGKPLKIIGRPVRSRIPIYIASLGEKNVALTAEIADGWLPVFYVPEKANDVFGKALAEGTAKRSADLGPLDIAAGGVVCITDDEAQAASVRDLGRTMAALYIGGMGAKGQNFYNSLVTRYGYEQEAAEIQDLYLAGNKQEAAAKVPAELLEKTSLRLRGLHQGPHRRLQGVGRHRAASHAVRREPRRSRREAQDLDRLRSPSSKRQSTEWRNRGVVRWAPHLGGRGAAALRWHRRVPLQGR